MIVQIKKIKNLFFMENNAVCCRKVKNFFKCKRIVTQITNLSYMGYNFLFTYEYQIKLFFTSEEVKITKKEIDINPGVKFTLSVY